MRSILSAAAVAGVMMMLAGGAAAAATAQDQEFQTGEGVTAPVLIKEVKPKYTADAMRRRVEGAVELSAVVQKDGKVGTMYVIRPLDDELDRQAMDALKLWEFKPGMKDGKAVNVRVNIEMTFTIKK